MQFHGQVSGTGVAAEFDDTITNVNHFIIKQAMEILTGEHSIPFMLPGHKDKTRLIKVSVITIKNLYLRPTIVASQRPAMLANIKSAHEH